MGDCFVYPILDVNSVGEVIPFPLIDAGVADAASSSPEDIVDVLFIIPAGAASFDNRVVDADESAVSCAESEANRRSSSRRAEESQNGKRYLYRRRREAETRVRL